MGCWMREEGCIVSKQNDAHLLINIWELLTECAVKNRDLDVKHVKARRTEKETAMTKEQTIVMEGHAKADELANDGSDVDGVQMAAARALTIK